MKKALSITIAGAVAFGGASITAYAAYGTGSAGLVNTDMITQVYNEDGEDISWSNSNKSLSQGDGYLTLDGVNPDQTIYIPLGPDSDTTYPTYLDDYTGAGTYDDTAYPEDLGDSDLFKISIDKDGSGKSLIKSIDQVCNKKLDGAASRGSYLKVVLGDSTTTSDLKATADITFKAKKTMDGSTSSLTSNSGQTWDSGDTATLKLTFWINNTQVSGSDGDAETGDSIYFSPDDNESNILVWGDDRAAIYFESDDDASDFYAKLSTKSDSDIYAEYGDPVNADLWFYDFVGNPSVPSTARATLTLGIPWDEDDDYVPDPAGCFVYLLDSDGILTDVTSSFTYSEDNDSTTGIEGWSIKTRTLGTYVVSDTEMELDSYYDDEEPDGLDDVFEEPEDTGSDAAGKEIPNTGSSDLVGVAVVAGVLSLAAAGALAIRGTALLGR